MSYTAESIRILTSAELKERFFFVRIGDLAKQYPSVSIEFISRLLEACHYSGFPEELAIKRYLDKDKSVTVSSEFIECHRELLEIYRVPQHRNN